MNLHIFVISFDINKLIKLMEKWNYFVFAHSTCFGVVLFLLICLWCQGCAKTISSQLCWHGNRPTFIESWLNQYCNWVKHIYTDYYHFTVISHIIPIPCHPVCFTAVESREALSRCWRHLWGQGTSRSSASRVQIKTSTDRKLLLRGRGLCTLSRT